MTRRFKGALMAAGAVAGLVGLATLEAAADVLVLDSRVAQLKRGAVLKNSDQIDVPLGASVTVVLPSGGTRSISGPAKMMVRDIAKDEPIDEGLWKVVAEFVSKGGGSQSGMGAVRSISRGVSEPLPFSWRQVPVDADGDYCVEQGAPLTLVSAPGARVTRVTVVDVQTSLRAEVRFPEGKTTAAWPDQVPAKVGTFALLVPDRPMHQVRLRLIDPLPHADQTLRVLHNQRCHVQVQAWLRRATGQDN